MTQALRNIALHACLKICPEHLVDRVPDRRVTQHARCSSVSMLHDMRNVPDDALYCPSPALRPPCRSRFPGS